MIIGEDETKSWLFAKFLDPEYQRATKGDDIIPKNMVEPCKWAVHECFSRAGSSDPMKLTKPSRFSCSQTEINDDVRQLFSPLGESDVMEVLSNWATKCSWNQVRERNIPWMTDVTKHVLINGVGRYKEFELLNKSDFLPNIHKGVLIWSASDAAAMPSTLLANVYPNAAVGKRKAPSSKAAGKAPCTAKASQAELRELGHAAWSLAHARC